MDLQCFANSAIVMFGALCFKAAKIERRKSLKLYPAISDDLMSGLESPIWRLKLSP